MGKIFISNAFSLQMLSGSENDVHTELSSARGVIYEWREAPDREWAIGHEDTSSLAQADLGWSDMTERRVNISLEEGDVLFVFQVLGGRLPLGTKTLPEGIKTQWIRVSLGVSQKTEYIAQKRADLSALEDMDSLREEISALRKELARGTPNKTSTVYEKGMSAGGEDGSCW